MAARPILLTLVWHMHQPSYFHAPTGHALLPWARLHATKDYRDMVDLLRSYPRVRCTFNLSPVLLDQIERIAAGEEDESVRLARIPAATLTALDRAAILRDFFSVHRERMLDPRPRYRELLRRAGEEGSGGPPLTEQECRDLQTWFHLAWVDPGYAGEEPIRSLLTKGEGFTEAEKGALLDWGRALAATVIPVYREAADAGQVELIASAHYHPILPLLIDSDAPLEVSAEMPLPTPPFRAPEDAVAQLRSARTSHARRFGAPPRGTWPPEGAVSEAALARIRAEGFTWAASDETVLARALELRDGERGDWPAARYRSYHVPTPSGSLAMLFRDRALSDRIGFVYQRWDPIEAADDFLEQVRSGAAQARGDGPALVTVILDGENCWEGYEEDGRPFLRALYERLEAHPSIEAVTVSTALERMPPSEELPRVPVGSWIRDDLAIWIGHPEKNRAWAAIRETRNRLRAGGDDASFEAWDALYAAEGSDWLWWYGDDHVSDQKDLFDALFRGHLLRVYAALSVEPPESLRASFREKDPDRMSVDEAEWADAATYDAVAAEGSMHRVSGVIGMVRYRLAGGDLRVRVEPREGALGEGGSLRIRLDRGNSPGAIRLDGTSPLLISVPLAQCPVGPEGVLQWRLELERAGAVEERAPRDGWFRTDVRPGYVDSERGRA